MHSEYKSRQCDKWFRAWESWCVPSRVEGGGPLSCISIQLALAEEVTGNLSCGTGLSTTPRLFHRVAFCWWPFWYFHVGLKWSGATFSASFSFVAHLRLMQQRLMINPVVLLYARTVDWRMAFLKRWWATDGHPQVCSRENIPAVGRATISSCGCFARQQIISSSSRWIEITSLRSHVKIDRWVELHARSGASILLFLF